MNIERPLTVFNYLIRDTHMSNARSYRNMRIQKTQFDNTIPITCTVCVESIRHLVHATTSAAVRDVKIEIIVNNVKTDVIVNNFKCDRSINDVIQ